MQVNFVTNLPLTETSGGWSGISARSYEELTRYFSTTFIGPINPKYPFLIKLISKIKRVSGLKGRFSLFSPNRLKKIAKIYEASRRFDAEFDFFHGATPWIFCKPEVKYGAYIDATFPMYLDIFSTRLKFVDEDIARITNGEKDWMKSASVLFFGSNWVMERAIRDYQLDPDKCFVTWVGGNVPIPLSDYFEGGRKFLFIALDFVKKGGYYCIEALEIVKQKYPDVELIIIGQKPPNDVIKHPNVKYAGFFNKTVKKELEDFCKYLGYARGLIHPTSMDTMGMVLLEAGYYSCPSIASRRFGIPELIKEKETGFLLDSPISVHQLAQFMLKLCENDLDYQDMRVKAREYTTRHLTWEKFGKRLHDGIVNCISI